jgi:hypothetical protein
MKTCPPAPPLSTRESVERIVAANAAGAAAQPLERLADALERAAEDILRLASEFPEAVQ